MRKVMLVEDERVIRAGLKKLVEQVIGGYSVCAEAADGREALRLLDRAQPDILITDIKMDGQGGLELIRQIRLHDAALPIIIISGYSDFRFAQTAISHGVAAYLVKPVDRLELMQALAKCFPAEEHISTDDQHDQNQLIQTVKATIKRRLHEEISLRTIADEVGINHQYLSALFKNRTGINFSKYVTDKRMQKAKQLLRESLLKVYEIAELSGYHSIKHFSSVFKETVGCTPSEYRNSQTEDPS